MKKLLLSLTFWGLAGALSAQPVNPLPFNPEDPAMFQLQKFTLFYRYLNNTYVDTINSEKLVEVAIKQMLAELDPHSAYLSPAEMKQVSEQFQGSFSGIGIEYTVINDTILVANTVVGGPSEKVGVLPNDRIVRIDAKPAVGLGRDQVSEKLRGPKGSVVEINVLRAGEPALLSFRIVRDNIPINSVEAAYKLNRETGYIKVSRFAQTTADEVNKALDRFGKIDALVLDLRGNGGGLLTQAIDISSLFLPKGSAIVSTEGRLAPTESYATKSNGRFMQGKLIVLTDENSASASEIVSGAIQDWDRGLVVGRRSFGKGLVQRQFPLIDGSSVRITVARYHTPTGRVIQRPFEMGRKDEYYASHLDRLDQRGLDTLPGSDSLRYKTLRKGRTVFGGGGIYPDVYVPIDTTGYSVYWAQLIRRGVINEFVTEYVAANREELLRKYADFESFESKYTVGPEMLDRLAALGERREVPLDRAGMELSHDRLCLHLKAYVAQRLWGLNEYYRVMHNADNVLDRAQEILNNWSKSAAAIL